MCVSRAIKKERMTKESAFVARAAYTLSALLILLPLADIALGFLPLQVNSVRWRIGVTGLTTGALLMPLIGLFLALSTAHLKGDRGVLMPLSIIAVVAAVILYAAMVMFTLDTLQLRNEVDPRARHMYDRAAAKGIITQLITASALMFVGLSSLRTAKTATRQGRQRPVVKPAGPIIGRSDVTTEA